MDSELIRPNNWQQFRNIARTILAAIVAAPLVGSVPAKAQEAPTEMPSVERIPTTSKGGIVFIPGLRSRGESWQRVVDKMTAMGLKATILQYPNGRERMTEQSVNQIIEAMRSDYKKFLDENHLVSKDVTLAGYSFGAYIAALLDAEVDAGRIIIRALPSYPGSALSHDKPIAELFDNPARYAQLLEARRKNVPDLGLESAMRSLRESRKHILCISHGADETTPPTIITKNCEHGERGSIISIEGATHTLNAQQQEQLADIVAQWISDPRVFLKK